MASSVYNNSISETRSYNNDNTLASINFTGASIGNLTYGWDNNKNKTSETITGTMSGYGFTTGTTGYDTEDRLVTWNRADNTLNKSWNLSLVGDWTSVTENATTQSRTHGPTHELLTAAGQNVTTDTKGNITLLPAALRPSTNPLSLTWDMDNRLSSADVDNDNTADVSYQWDALGRRVARTSNSTTTIYVQSGQQTIADYPSGAAPSSPTYTYYYASYIDEPVMRAGVGSLTYFHQNQQYSVVALTDANGNVKERYAYDAYGTPTITDGAGATRTSSVENNRYTYTGREWDEELGLYHYRARMYDAISGRFCSRDPIGFVGSPWNLYEYGNSGPMSGTDPSGKKFASCCIAIACLARQDAACMLACAYDPVWDDRSDTWSDCYFKCRKAVLVGKLKGLSDAACIAAVYACGGRVLNEWAKYAGPARLPQPVMPQGPQGPLAPLQ